jgi:hypothetical protein
MHVIALDDTSSDQKRAESRPGPVFVDASGRRLRQVKLVGLGALALVAGYVILLLLAFVGGSSISAPYLPLPAAVKAPDLPSPPPAPASSPAGVPEDDALPAGPGAAVAVPAPAPAPTADPVTASANNGAVEAPVHGGAVEAPAPAGPVAADVPSGKEAAPGLSGTSPGQATRPSAAPRP